MTETDRPGEVDLDRVQRDVMRHLPMYNPFALFMEGMGKGILGRFQRLRQQSAAVPSAPDLGESEGVIHPEPDPLPPGPRNPQEPQP